VRPQHQRGRRKDVVDAVVEALRPSGVRVLDVQSDKDHNRSVLTPGR
jgi:glutamate formiminotransferase